ncbi:hypothetical protein Tco_1170641, partial [Tanacetum coccineum]
MLRLQGLGSNTPSGVPYTDDEIMVIVRGGKHPGDHFRFYLGSDEQVFQMLESQPDYVLVEREVAEWGDDEPGDDEDGGEDEEDVRCLEML